MYNILLIGNGAREHVIAETVKRSRHKVNLLAYMKSNNPGIASLSEKVMLGSYNDLNDISAFAKEHNVDFAIIGPEDPLNSGVVDALIKENIPSVGPTKLCARLETSKMFTRNLLEKYDIPGNARFRVFTALKGIPEFIGELDGIVLKPDGLTGGKGVMVQGDHFNTREEAIEKCRDILNEHASVIVEEKFDGEEFSLQCLCDGTTVVATPPVQDHKRRYVGDKGPNTGGMGSYSMADHLLPFMTAQDVEAGLDITRRVAHAIRQETGEGYKGIMYGGFIITKDGVKLLEYNARFGDPEAMNTLPLLKTDFVDVCRAIINGVLKELTIEFEKKATVCKYIVPKGYGLPKDHPDALSTSARIAVDSVEDVNLYYSSVDKRDDGLYMTTSRAIGIVGIADNLEDAEKKAERAISSIQGPVDHRIDIGTQELIKKRIAHMDKIRE